MLLPGFARGHTFEQFSCEMVANETSWEAEFGIEAWAFYPQDTANSPKGEPGDPGVAGSEWMSTLGPFELQVLREDMEATLRECFFLTIDGKALPMEVGFPDFETDPPAFEENEKNNAEVRVVLKGDFPEGVTGPVELVWADDFDEPLAIDVVLASPRGDPSRKVLNVPARKDPVELFKVEAAQSLVESRESSLSGWIVAGFEHILPKGLDHILFVLGLFLLRPRARPLLSQSLAFTVAHSITLAMVVLGVFSVSPRFVESMIALSIAYVGIENLWVKELKPWRVVFVFGLGLLHGMGFASVMQDLDLPSDSLIEPLIGFNLGVELGQITVLALAFAATFWFFKRKGFELFRKSASAAIAVTGLYWTFERALG